MITKPSNRSLERKLQVVLSVWRRERSATEAASRSWGGRADRAQLEEGLLGSGPRWPGPRGHRRRSSRELELEAKNEELKAALGEDHVQRRVQATGSAER